MAKSKTSQQEDLTSKTGINVMSELGFKKPIGMQEKSASDKKNTKETASKSVDNLAEAESTAKNESAKLSQKEEPPAAKPVITKPSDSKKSKLKRPDDPDKEVETCKISAIISAEAKANLERYSKLYGYKKMSPFLNDLLERLDLYMD